MSGSVNKNPRDVVLEPVVSEKSYGLIDEGKYTFLVDPRSNKTEIKQAVEEIFKGVISLEFFFKVLAVVAEFFSPDKYRAVILLGE